VYKTFRMEVHVNRLVPTIALASIIAFGTLLFPSVAVAAVPSPLDLGVAKTFAVLAGTGITNTGATTVTGDIGTYPTATESGFPPGVVVGTNHGGDATTQAAKTALGAAYSYAAARTANATVPTELGGTTLTPGVYNSAAGDFGLHGTLTLDAQGHSNAIFILQMASTLTTGTGGSVLLTNGAQDCNVFWQVGSSATIGTGTALVGTILALTSITLVSGATVTGRALAENGAVTMDTNTVTNDCATVTVAHVARFKARWAHGSATFDWRMANQAGVAGFAAYAGAHRLNNRLIPVHRSKQYHYQAHWKRNGHFSLQIVLDSGQRLSVEAH
jgi:hypothetical protein